MNNLSLQNDNLKKEISQRQQISEREAREIERQKRVYQENLSRTSITTDTEVAKLKNEIKILKEQCQIFKEQANSSTQKYESQRRRFAEAKEKENALQSEKDLEIQKLKDIIAANEKVLQNTKLKVVLHHFVFWHSPKFEEYVLNESIKKKGENSDSEGLVDIYRKKLFEQKKVYQQELSELQKKYSLLEEQMKKKNRRWGRSSF